MKPSGNISNFVQPKNKKIKIKTPRRFFFFRKLLKKILKKNQKLKKEKKKKKKKHGKKTSQINKSCNHIGAGKIGAIGTVARSTSRRALNL